MNKTQRLLFKKIQEHHAEHKQITKIGGTLFYETIRLFPPHLENAKAERDLATIYEVYFHPQTDSIVVCNVGASLLTRSPFTATLSCLYHMGFCIINKEHGIEIANVGIVGDLKKSKNIVIRAESACAPGFIFGSQRCNCQDQWLVIREVAAQMNKCHLSTAKYEELENSIANYIKRNDQGIPVPFKIGQAFVLIHLDSQNGMGSGANKNSFSVDLTATAFLRHRGEYTAEQIHKTTMAGGFTSIGLIPDPRTLHDNFAYKIPIIILDYFKIKKPLIVLTNNQHKLKELCNAGYDLKRLLFLGRADDYCSLETRDRMNEFNHLIPPHSEISPQQEVEQLKKQITLLNS